MTKLLRHAALTLLLLLWAATGFSAENGASDDFEGTTISFFSDNATMEDNPNKNNYNITIFSPDGEWKVQLNYNSDNMFGTFGNEEFNLSGDGKYYNFARNPKNDMKFYSFNDMTATVSDEGTLYRVKADCRTSSGNMRFTIEATIAAPLAKDTISCDMGYARVMPNAFIGSYEISAENNRYKLAYGIIGDQLTGTFYRADILLPELTDKQTGQMIPVRSAYAVHTQDGETTKMTIDILGEDLTMYHMTMFNGPYEVEIKQEVYIDLLSGVVMQDLTAMYGCYQLAGENEEYAVAIAVKPEVIEASSMEWEMEDFFLPYTNIVDYRNQTIAEIQSLHAVLTKENGNVIIKAEATCMDGTLYHITMVVSGNGGQPVAKETVNIDFGHLVMLDYSHGMGTVGMGASVQGKYQMRFYMHTYVLDGDFQNDEFVLDMCDIMVINPEGFVFHDAKYVTAHMEQQEDGRINITVDMLGVDDINYHGTMYLDPLQCLQEGHTYSLDMKDDIYMVSISEDSDGDNSDYILQLQCNVSDESEVLEGGYVFSFFFNQKNKSIAGEYGYSDGTMMADIHSFCENGCQVRLAPVAGTLTIAPVQQVTLRSGLQTYKTWLYNISFRFVGENAVIYEGQGQNYLVCINPDGQLIEMDESQMDSIAEQLAEQGLKVRKVLKGGRIIVEKQDATYDLNGRRINIR